MTSIDISKNEFLDWCFKNPKKPYLNLSKSLLQRLNKLSIRQDNFILHDYPFIDEDGNITVRDIKINRKDICVKENYIVDDVEEDVEIILRYYPCWVIQDIHYIYNTIICSIYEHTPISILFEGLPSNYIHIDEITTKLVEDIYDGMIQYLEYLIKQNNELTTLLQYLTTNLFQITVQYIQYIHERML